MLMTLRLLRLVLRPLLLVARELGLVLLLRLWLVGRAAAAALAASRPTDCVWPVADANSLVELGSCLFGLMFQIVLVGKVAHVHCVIVSDWTSLLMFRGALQELIARSQIKRKRDSAQMSRR